jgi:predicted phage-related endonuclease
MIKPTVSFDRRHFIGGSDARIIMGKDEKALLRLWREKRGEEAAPNLSGVLIVQLGLVTEDLNRRWYELNSGHRISDIQRHAVHRTMPWMAATLDGLVKETGAVFEAKFMLPWSFSEEAAAEKHMAQLQHNMLVAGTKKSVLSIINGGGKWIELTIEADPIYQTILIAAELKRAIRSASISMTAARFSISPVTSIVLWSGSTIPRPVDCPGKPRRTAAAVQSVLVPAARPLRQASPSPTLQIYLIVRR